MAVTMDSLDVSFIIISGPGAFAFRGMHNHVYCNKYHG